MREATTIYEWHIDVQRMNHYGDRVERTTPVVIIAATKTEVTEKVRAAFEATYDSFRKFWSHQWTLREVREVALDTGSIVALLREKTGTPNWAAHLIESETATTAIHGSTSAAHHSPDGST